jgi:hypothetical protein
VLSKEAILERIAFFISDAPKSKDAPHGKA